MIESPVPIAILASGRGSNFEAVHHAIQEGRLNARIVAVVSDREDARVLEKARSAGLKAFWVPVRKGQTRAEHEDRILETLREFSPRFLVLAGYMRIVTPRLLDAFRSDRGYSRIVNIHPSLLPAFPGINGYAQAFLYGAKVAGVTIHLVDEGLDSGPICAQEAFSIADCRSIEEVEERGLAVEHRLYPSVLAWLLPEKFEFTALARPGEVHRAPQPYVGQAELSQAELSQAELRRFSVRPN